MNEKVKKIIKQQEAGITNVVESLSSTKLTRMGGEIRPEVKVYHKDPYEASRIAQELMDDLNKKYKVNE